MSEERNASARVTKRKNNRPKEAIQDTWYIFFPLPLPLSFLLSRGFVNNRALLPILFTLEQGEGGERNVLHYKFSTVLMALQILRSIRGSAEERRKKEIIREGTK